MSDAAKNIVFDWNCTLLDDVHALHSCTNNLLQRQGHGVLDIERFRDNYAIPFDQFYRKMGFTEGQVTTMLTLENSMFHDHYEPLADQSALREGAADILAVAHKHGISSYILSNHIIDPIKAQLKRLAIEHLFAEVLAYADRATQFKHMTKGEKLKQFMDERQLRPQHTMIVGDTIEEIFIARDHGLISVAITGGCVSEQRLREEKPDYVIHSLHELKPIMQERGFIR
ncbi:MAG: HAD family hydrolase [Alphaproteobacteria bacterium]